MKTLKMRATPRPPALRVTMEEMRSRLKLQEMRRRTMEWPPIPHFLLCREPDLAGGSCVAKAFLKGQTLCLRVPLHRWPKHLLARYKKQLDLIFSPALTSSLPAVLCRDCGCGKKRRGIELPDCPAYVDHLCSEATLEQQTHHRLPEDVLRAWLRVPLSRVRDSVQAARLHAGEKLSEVLRSR